jgi:hypothetical protein
MKNNTCIIFTSWRRPTYLREAIKSVIAAGGGEYPMALFADLDEKQGECVDVFRRMAIDGWVIEHDKRMHCNGNILSAIQWFVKSPYERFILVEDDILLATDAIRYFEWALDTYRDDKDIFTVAAWRHDEGWLPESGRPEPVESHLVKRMPYFNCWGWASWRDRAEEMVEQWTTTGDFELSWCSNMNHNIRGNRNQIAPMLSRAINIGQYGGTHRGDYLLTRWGAGDGRPFEEIK